MAQLDAATRQELTAQALKALCARRVQIPISHQDVEATIATIDAELESAEIAILAAVAPAVATWLTANQSIAREIVVRIEQKRKEVL